jgi:hypothetical protein
VLYCDDDILVTRQTISSNDDMKQKPDLYTLWKRVLPTVWRRYWCLFVAMPTCSNHKSHPLSELLISIYAPHSFNEAFLCTLYNFLFMKIFLLHIRVQDLCIHNTFFFSRIKWLKLFFYAIIFHSLIQFFPAMIKHDKFWSSA